jgi:hypothetical protein
LRWEQCDAGDDHGEREKGDHANAASPRHDAQGTLHLQVQLLRRPDSLFFFSFVLSGAPFSLALGIPTLSLTLATSFASAGLT